MGARGWLGGMVCKKSPFFFLVNLPGFWRESKRGCKSRRPDDMTLREWSFVVTMREVSHPPEGVGLVLAGYL